MICRFARQLFQVRLNNLLISSKCCFTLDQRWIYKFETYNPLSVKSFLIKLPQQLFKFHTFNEKAGKVASSVNDAIGPDKDSALQYGLNTPNNPITKLPSLGEGGSAGNALGGLLPGEAQQAVGPPSGDKSKSFGNNDFWVVKIRDRSKPIKVKASIEALPNPARDYTNVIIGYDYNSGTATVVDLAGHVLETFAITDRTVPVNLSRYPDGIYIVNIKTDKGSEGVKVIKNNK